MFGRIQQNLRKVPQNLLEQLSSSKSLIKHVTTDSSRLDMDEFRRWKVLCSKRLLSYSSFLWSTVDSTGSRHLMKNSANFHVSHWWGKGVWGIPSKFKGRLQGEIEVWIIKTGNARLKLLFHLQIGVGNKCCQIHIYHSGDKTVVLSLFISFRVLFIFEETNGRKRRKPLGVQSWGGGPGPDGQ